MRGTTAFPFAISASLLSACLSQPARADGACGEALLPARGLLATAQRARQPSKTAVEKARAAWAAVPAACQGGAWYALGAAILRNPGPGARQPLAEGKRSFAAPKDALEAGLKAAPQDPELLAYVAYLGRVQPEASPPLPKEACARLKDADPAVRDYVCGVQALADGRGAEAARLFGAFTSRRFPDIGELRALAEKAGGKGGAKAPVPAPQLGCDPFCPQELWRAAPK